MPCQIRELPEMRNNAKQTVRYCTPNYWADSTQKQVVMKVVNHDEPFHHQLKEAGPLTGIAENKQLSLFATKSSACYVTVPESSTRSLQPPSTPSAPVLEKLWSVCLQQYHIQYSYFKILI
jgi:hypothetical protein